MAWKTNGGTSGSDPTYLEPRVSAVEVKTNNMAKVPNRQTWVATEGQTDFTISNGSISNVNLLDVYVGGVPQDEIILVNSTTFRFSESLSVGMKVYAEWFEVEIPIGQTHKSTHEKNGADEIDITKLKNYDVITSQLADISTNVKLFGAKGDGVTDDTAAIQAAINYAKTIKGVVYVPIGTYIVEGIVLPSYISVLGAGNESTIFKLKAGSTKDVFVSESFDTLTGTGNRGGVSSVRIADFQINGNRANCPSGGWGIKKYGYRWLAENIKIKECKAGGVYGEWSDWQGAGTDGDLMEDEWNNLRIYNCDTYGIRWRGAHDSRFNDVLIYIINGTGLLIENGTGYIGSSAWHNLHVYACTGDGIVLNGTMIGTFIQSESNTGNGIVINANAWLTHVTTYLNNLDGIKLQYSDCILQGVRTYQNTGYGFVVGSVTVPANANFINGKSYVNTAGEVNLFNDGGSNKISLVTWNTDAAKLKIGTLHQNSSLELIHSSSAKTYGTTAERPTNNLYAGRTFYDTTLKKPVWHNGTIWKNFFIESYKPITQGWASYNVTLSGDDVQSDTNYGVLVTPGWNAGGVWITGKSTTQFTVNWVTAPPADSFIAFRLIR